MGRNEDTREVAIIGAGFGGIGLGIRLHRAGMRDFVILEKSNSIGGVWRDNTYPGAACDVPSRLYSYSFEQSWPWQSRFGRQSEILAYLNHCADKYDVIAHIRLETQVTSACFDDEMGLWRVALSSGETILVRVLVSGVGIFNQPIVPDIPGRATFAGPSFHSSEWNHAIDLSGRRVAVIGTGASAIQFVPEIAKVAGQLHVCHRSPQYVRPRDERVMGRRPRDRWDILREFDNGTARRYSDELAAEARTAWLHYLTTEVPDPALRAKLTPTYPFGCKRMLQSNDWYPALQRPNVELINVPVEQITQDAIRTSDGVTRNVDVIIYGTGFRPTAYLPHLHITGRAGFDLAAAWQDGAEAYLGLTVSGCPNFFMLYGPNTNSSGSIIFFLECQARYIVRCLKAMRSRRARTIEIRADVLNAFNEEVRARLSDSVIADAACHTYFKLENGRIVTQWPWTMREYRRRTRRLDPGDYVFEADAGSAEAERHRIRPARASRLPRRRPSPSSSRRQYLAAGT